MTRQLHILGIGGTLSRNSRSLWALKRALAAARTAGASTEVLAIRDLNLPMFDPDKPLANYDQRVHTYIDAARRADAMIWSTAGYHGTLVGATKNALDFLEFLSDEPQPYLHNKVVGLIATSGGELAGVNAVNAMVHTVHALRGTTVPLFVVIPQAKKAFDSHGDLLIEKWARRLDQLGQLVVSTTRNFRQEATLSSS